MDIVCEEGPICRLGLLNSQLVWALGVGCRTSLHRLIPGCLELQSPAPKPNTRKALTGFCRTVRHAVPYGSRARRELSISSPVSISQWSEVWFDYQQDLWAIDSDLSGTLIWNKTVPKMATSSAARAGSSRNLLSMYYRADKSTRTWRESSTDYPGV